MSVLPSRPDSTRLDPDLASGNSWLTSAQNKAQRKKPKKPGECLWLRNDDRRIVRRVTKIKNEACTGPRISVGRFIDFHGSIAVDGSLGPANLESSRFRGASVKKP